MSANIGGAGVTLLLSSLTSISVRILLDMCVYRTLVRTWPLAGGGRVDEQESIGLLRRR